MEVLSVPKKKQPTKDTINYLEYVHLLKFLVDRKLYTLSKRIVNGLKQMKFNVKTKNT
jgi:hypothetical protein